MAKAVTLKNNNNEEVYPVTDISLVNGELNGARIVNASVGSDKLTPNAVWEENIKDGAVTSDKIDWTTLMQSGEWVLADSASLSSNTNGTSFLQVTVPTALQGANVEYKLIIGAEFLASHFPSYPYLNCQKSDGTWGNDDKDFSYIRTAVVNNNAANVYTATKVNPLAFEWVITSDNCSCSAEVIVGRAGTGNFWNAVGRAGGFSDAGASSVSLAARTQWAASISGFRIQCTTTITLLAGSHMSLWARKTNVKH